MIWRDFPTLSILHSLFHSSASDQVDRQCYIRRWKTSLTSLTAEQYRHRFMIIAISASFLRHTEIRVVDSSCKPLHSSSSSSSPSPSPSPFSCEREGFRLFFSRFPTSPSQPGLLLFFAPLSSRSIVVMNEKNRIVEVVQAILSCHVRVYKWCMRSVRCYYLVSRFSWIDADQ